MFLHRGSQSRSFCRQSETAMQICPPKTSRFRPEYFPMLVSLDVEETVDSTFHFYESVIHWLITSWSRSASSLLLLRKRAAFWLIQSVLYRLGKTRPTATQLKASPGLFSFPRKAFVVRITNGKINRNCHGRNGRKMSKVLVYMNIKKYPIYSTKWPRKSQESHWDLFCFLLLVCRYQKLWKENWSQEVGVDVLEFKTGPVLFKSSSL